MSRSDPRDQAIESELRRRGVAPADRSTQCLDAETLAAWADGGLGGDARVRAEVHVASCARCQSILAAIVSSETGVEPAAAGSRRGAWWRIDLRWLVPLAGAAAAVLLWSVVPDRPDVRQVRIQETGPRLVDRAPADSPAVSTPSESPAPDPAPKTNEEKLVRAEPVRPSAARQKSLDERESQERADNDKERNRNAADLMAKAEAPAPPVAGIAPAAPPPSEPNRVEADRPAAAAPAPAIQAFGRAAEEGRAAAGGSRIDLVSAIPGIRWRIANPAIVERSVDGGASWEPVDTGVRSLLVSGSCPSATVCWVVGHAGVVLLTTDARTWQRVSSPGSDDLIGVEASSDQVAVVRTATGRTFRTADRGATWSGK